jgi:hypothetical protein
LIEREASYGKKGFQLQFQLDASLADAERYPLRASDLIVTDIDSDIAPEKIVYGSSPDLAYGDELPNMGFNGDRFYRPMAMVGEHSAYKDRILSIDPSGRGRDETSVAALKFLNSYIFLPELRGIRGGYSEAVMAEIKEMAYNHKVYKILIESNFGDGMFGALLRPILNKVTYTKEGKEIPPYPVELVEVRAQMQKEKRIIDTLEPVMARHRLIVDPKVIKSDYDTIQDYDPQRRSFYSLIHQLTHITYEKGCLDQDDRLDCLAQGVAHFVEEMSMDEDKVADMRREAANEEAFRRFSQTQISDGGYLKNRNSKAHGARPSLGVWGS